MSLLGDMLGGSGGVADELGVTSDANSNKGDTYQKPLSVSDFDSFGASLVDTDTEVELARIESPNGIERRWGFGRADLPENQGYFYGVLKNADGEQIHGKLIYKWENATGRETQVHTEADSEDMSTTDRYNRDAQIPIPEQTDKEKAEAFESLVVKFEPTTPASDITNNYAIDAASSEVRYPTTEYDVA